MLLVKAQVGSLFSRIFLLYSLHLFLRFFVGFLKLGTKYITYQKFYYILLVS